MLRRKHRPASVLGSRRLGIEPLERRALLSGTPIHVDTFEDVSDPGDGLTSLREAIVEAADHAGDDRILLPKGHYGLEQGQLEINDPSGKLTIESGGAVIDAQGSSRVMYVSGAETDLRLEGLTITGGVIANDPAVDFGGGIFNDGGTVTVKNSRITGNLSNEGGGILNGGGGTLVLNNSVVSDNRAEADVFLRGNGGGIITDGIFGGTHEVTLINSRVTDNEAGNDGGGLWIGARDTVTLTNSRVTENEAANDGGGIFSGGSLTLRRSRVNENEAGNVGGGVLNAVGASLIRDKQSEVKDNDPDDIHFA